MIVTHYVNELPPPEGEMKLVSIITKNEKRWYNGGYKEGYPLEQDYIEYCEQTGDIVKLKKPVKLKLGFGLWLTSDRKIKILKII
jgi:hypothetical protein